jgi:hypothetical protein
MPKGEMFTTAYYIRNIFTEIAVRHGMERGERKLVVHAGNAKPHTAKVTRVFCDDNYGELHYIRYIHRTSRTWFPLIFSGFLFGHLKDRFEGQQFGFADEFLSGVRKILDEISVDTLEMFFRE